MVGIDDEEQKSLLAKPQRRMNSRQACWFMTQLVGGTLALFVLGALVVVVRSPVIGTSGTSATASVQNLNQMGDDQLPVYVHLECGEVKGTVDVETSLSVYRGIPYATVPGRFLPSIGISKQQQTCWKGDVLDATKDGPICMQERSPMMMTMDVDMSEDCLSLNVWTPKQARPVSSHLLPVLVFIHGGALTLGYSSWDGVVPWPVAQTDQVIVVSINYRLGAFGWLAVDAVQDPESPVKGNFGLLDCMQALRWVRRNVAAFGGDHRKVTIVGQGSGATLVQALVASPLAKGLFAGAVSMSGSTLRHTAAQASKIQMEKVVSQTRCAGKASDSTAPPRGRECGKEGGSCECMGRVHYGIDGKYSWHESFGEIGCNNEVFGDPVVGRHKTCYCEEAKFCAHEDERCECVGRVQYGDKGKFEFRQSTGSIACTNQEFGDPIVGVVKECYCLPEEGGARGRGGGDEGGSLRECLMGLGAEELTKAVAAADSTAGAFKLPGEQGAAAAAVPWLVVDGHSQVEGFEAGLQRTRVPVLFGEMREELARMPAKEFAPNATEADAASYLAKTLAEVIGEQEHLADTILELYPRPQSAQELYLEVASDIRCFCPTLSLARSTAGASPHPVYLYQMAYRLPHPLLSPGSPPVDFAFHSLDLLLLAHRHGQFPLSQLSLTDIQAKMLLQTALIHFAWTGAIPSWYEVGFANDYVVNKIGEGRADPLVHSFKAYGEAKCDFWGRFGALDKFAWIN